MGGFWFIAGISLLDCLSEVMQGVWLEAEVWEKGNNVLVTLVEWDYKSSNNGIKQRPPWICINISNGKATGDRTVL